MNGAMFATGEGDCHFCRNDNMLPRFQQLLIAALALLLTVPPVMKHCCYRSQCCNIPSSTGKDFQASQSNCSHRSSNASPPRGCRCVRHLASSFSASQNAVKNVRNAVASVFARNDRHENDQGLVGIRNAVEPRTFQGRRLQIAFCVWRC